MKKPSLSRIATHIKVLGRRIVNTCRSPQGKEIFTFLGFVVLAFCFWFILAIRDSRECSVRIPLELVNVPDGAVLINDIPPYIEARINDTGAAVMGYGINGVSPLKINFTLHDNHKGAVVVSSNSIIDYLRNHLKSSSTILAYSPDSLRITYTMNPGKRVPIEVAGSFTPSPHHALGETITLLPDSVTVYGPEATLRKIDRIATEEFFFDSLEMTTTVKVALKRIAGTRLIPDSVAITVPIEEFTTKTFTIPVTVAHVPQGYSVMTFPSHLQVTCIIPAGKYTETEADAFLIGTDYEELRKHPGSQVAIEIVNAPDFARSVTISQDSVEYIINELTPAAVHTHASDTTDTVQ